MGDNDLLELINSDSSYTMNDESIIETQRQSITFWETSKITIMEDMFNDFNNKEHFNELLLWNTKNVTNMFKMFNGLSSFNQPLEFNTKNVTDICDDASI